MRKNLITIGIVFVLNGCSTQVIDPAQPHIKVNMSTQTIDNVLFYPSPLQDQAPQFDQIVSSDYLPAFRLGMKQHNTEIAAIVNNTASATFDNTISAMETSGEQLNRVSRAFLIYQR